MIEFISHLYNLVPTVDYCEQPTGHLIERPYYAISNFAFIVVGIVILLSNRKSPLAKAFGIAAVLVSVFSFVYDSTYSYLFQLFDVAGMYILVTMLIFLNLKRLKIEVPKIYRWLLIIISLIMFYFLKGEAGNVIFGFFVVSIIVSEWLNRESSSRLDWFVAIALFVSGFGIWLLDATKIWCDPNGIFNGRFIFHLFEAAAIYYLFRYYQKLNHSQS